MATSLQDIINIVRSQRVRGATTSCLEREIVNVHRLITGLIPDLRQHLESPLEIDLVQNQRAYNLPENILGVSQVVLKLPSSEKSLKPSTYQEFRGVRGSTKPWVSEITSDTATIEKYFILGVATSNTETKAQIVLNNAPGAVTTEKLRIYGTVVEPVMTLNATFLSPLLSGDSAYIECLAWKAALESAPNLSQTYFAAFQGAIQLERSYIKTFNDALGTKDHTQDSVRMS